MHTFLQHVGVVRHLFCVYANDKFKHVLCSCGHPKLKLLAIYCLWHWTLLSQNAATTSVFDGDLEFNRTSLYQMCEAKQCPQACYFWEPECNPTTTLWCEYNLTLCSLFVHLFCEQSLTFFFLPSCPFSTFHMSLLFVIGCSWGHKNQLCWVSH